MDEASIDPRVQVEIWERFAGNLRGFIAARIADPADAEDLLQEAFLRLVQKPPEEGGNPRGWLFTVVSNLISDYYRRRKSFVRFPLENLPTVEPFEVRESEQEVAGWLRAMVEGLPARYRRALLMADFEGKSMKDIATTLNLSLSGAKSRVQRGRKLLAKALQACCTFHFDRQGRVEGWRRNQEDCKSRPKSPDRAPGHDCCNNT